MTTPEYAFCETLYASGSSPWHIRKLTAYGLRPGGGADNAALCGSQVAWDLKVPLTDHHLKNSACSVCAKAYAEAKA